MKKFRYFSVFDSTQETIGEVDAWHEQNAYKMASLIKKLPQKEFKKLFKIEEVK
jgi:hypothetical protein